MTDKQIVAAGSDTWIGADPTYTDEEITEYFQEKYGWAKIRMKRMRSIVLVQPQEAFPDRIEIAESLSACEEKGTEGSRFVIA